MASFNGFDLGIIKEISLSVAQNERQYNAYNGVNGLESLDQGGRGGTTTVRGVLAGVDLADLYDLQNTLRAFQVAGGTAYFFDDVYTWPYVILSQFRPTGPRRQLDGQGCLQEYEAEFLHLLIAF